MREICGAFLPASGFMEISGAKGFSNIIRLFVPVTTKSRIKFIRWSVELMILGTGVK